MSHARTLALDVGDRRIGVAITDPLGWMAQPLFTLHRATPKPNLHADLKAVARFIRQHKVEVIVVGHPLNADGTTGPQAVKAQAFAEALREHLAESHPELPIHLFDERLTTVEAHEILDRSGQKPQNSKAARLTREEQIDQIAATLLLESWLSLHSGPTLLPDPDQV